MAEAITTFATSGSTGQPRLVKISRRALDWSAATSQQALGGPGRWVEALPADHVAGAQVLNRARLSQAAGIEKPLVICGSPNQAKRVHFSVPELVMALESAFALPPAPIYLSLVPTELFAVVNAPEPVRARAFELLARCSAILLGGAALDSALRTEISSHHLPIVTTYGMTETSGGCVYDGVPWPGVTIRLNPTGSNETDTGIVEISGPMLADGYDPADNGEAFFTQNGQRWFRTQDLGRWNSDGRLEIIGRVDDVIISGGVNIHPQPVADAIETAWFELTGLETQVIAIGLPDERWGQRVIAVIEHSGTIAPELANQVIIKAKAQLGPFATPKQLVALPELPRLPGGKVDRKKTKWKVTDGVEG